MKLHKNENRCSHCMQTSTETIRIKHASNCTNIGPRPKKEKTMKQKVLAVRDTKSETFLSPITVKTIGEAERGFKDEVNNPQSMMCKHPEDFGLYLLGEYDNLTGILIPESQPKHIASAINHKQAPTAGGSQGAY